LGISGQSTGNAGEKLELSGDHRFTRLNPALGLNFLPIPELVTFISYSEGMRVPTPMELTCASPDAPCKLPNNFLADPPLNPVISRNWELGLRSLDKQQALQYRVGIFHNELSDDLQFISTSNSTANTGYFKNVGSTRRQGMELEFTSAFDAWHLAGSYSLTRATYQSAFTVHSAANSEADANGDIQVRPGNHLSASPEQNLKLRLEYRRQNFHIGGTLIVVGEQYARGDENNLDSNGRLPRYQLFNLDASYNIAKGWQGFARIDNLTNYRYFGFAVLGQNYFSDAQRGFNADLPGNEQFRSPGSPRAIWLGLRYQWE